MEAKVSSELHIDDIETFNNHADRNRVVGSTKLINDSEVVLVPTPSNDPNGKISYPLNLPVWQKYVILLIVGLFAATGNLMTSGMSAFLPAVQASYNGDPKTNDLITWPAFFMGVGNLIAIPLSYAVGRRPIYLFSTILLAFGCLWCAKSKSLGSHIAGRDIMSIAAGTCEALCPIIVQEIFYLHERGKVVAAFSALQTVGTAALIIASPYIASDTNLGWRWWYGTFGCVSGAVAVLSIIFVKETKYERSVEALNGEGIESDGIHAPVTTRTARELDNVNYRPRSFVRDMAPWSSNAQWSLTIECCKQMCQVFFFPNVLWLILLNSAGLGIYVLMSALFAEVLLKPPYLWAFNTLGYVFTGQIATAVAVPIVCGYFSDLTTRWLSKRNNGVSEPEYRLLAVILPTVAILISTIIYGRTAEHPENWTWAGIAVTLNFEYFGFVGIVVSSFVYCMDAYPQRVDAALVLICSCRGFIGFGISYGAIAFVNKAGYEGAFNICAGIMGALMFIGIFVYVFGRQIRRKTERFAVGN
ncbi:major facilitator superfamily domain-containing protein [Aspergillus granulosus]|uniref:Major facilitator superfamily domain-containing protein n=1 Tax=Aspergillus granulosus TaxID=176169 RepID=A0ABR4H8M3_9EURO